MVNYTNGKIYKIISKNSNECYIGSTTDQLNKRFACHLSNYKMFNTKNIRYCKSIEIIKCGNPEIVLIENFPCNNEYELRTRELYFINNTENCINELTPIKNTPKINRFHYSKIYKIISAKCDKSYIGSTTQELNRRLQSHKNTFNRYCNGKTNYISSFEIIKHDDCQIILLEEFKCENVNELLLKEQEYISSNDCVNKNCSVRSKKQYRLDNTENIKKYTKEYRHKNREKIKEQKSEYDKKYREQNKEKITNYKKQYYDNNKEKILKRNKEIPKIRILCDCGKEISKKHFNEHIRSQKHIDKIKCKN
ncbi:GIY-YIg endonuclease [Fadolivirus algeromassiliense]|jgi:hypothetical protein|uniref:GIY-YIg endonuclease n=1 Tax=Fadolivirus FV1/VV64 TaxID=3070911 RepID=A0A7D3UTE5_9VIRU|nr:GIY-YIg endonuclease [Fadolivirus algeromassiliense]QKF94250.1 GIY-YIg endonuclease [Fadolivirus FV1/VV64]